MCDAGARTALPRVLARIRAGAPIRRRPPKASILIAATATMAACAGGAPSSGPAPVASASEAEWQALATPRPEPLPGSARVTVGEIRLMGSDPWDLEAAVDVPLGMSELVAAGLLRRRDVHFVERRRFAIASERERRGLPRPPGAPAAGVSPGAELLLTGTWASLGLESAYLELRLTDVETGDVVRSWRTATPNDPDPAALARVAVGGLMEALGEMGRRPEWTDPRPESAPTTYQATSVPTAAVESFLRGLAAEERWSWDGALGGYRAAAAVAAGFFEAEVALARAARLRMGGTLGQS